MTTPPQDVEREALAFMAEAEGPVGSQRLAHALVERGITVAEATAGRYLTALQRLGLTAGAGPKQGRTITAKGRRRLAELERDKAMQEHGASVAAAVRIADVDDLVAVLQVRRGVESEAAGLAAAQASDDELAAIHGQALEHVRIAESGEIPTPQDSSAFHRSVADASHNSVLVSVAAILLDPANSQRLRSGEEVSLRSQAIAAQAAEHLAIAEAMLRRDAPLAEQLMREHMSHFLEAAEKYRVDDMAVSRPDRSV